jgi:hypothetical protein
VPESAVAINRCARDSRGVIGSLELGESRCLADVPSGGRDASPHDTLMYAKLCNPEIRHIGQIRRLTAGLRTHRSAPCRLPLIRTITTLINTLADPWPYGQNTGTT